LAVASGVAVAGWQRYQSKEEINAVRMVPVKRWQWQYWQSCGDRLTSDRQTSLRTRGDSSCAEKMGEKGLKMVKN
jgi:hypothetical protein